MESNTFATSTYIEAPEPDAFKYLCDLRNLDEWTLYSRMVEQVDDNTWRGTASGYQHDLFYNAQPIVTPSFRGVEWRCGFKHGEYFQCYPAVLFPASYAGSDENGAYFHWLSFIGPERRTPMIMQGIDFVHTAEIRSLKSALERRAGLQRAAQGRFEIKTASIFVDAPLDLAASYLGDVGNYAGWAYFVRPDWDGSARDGMFRDEYDQSIRVEIRTYPCGGYVILEIEHRYPDTGYVQRSCMFLVPCAHAFGIPGARGCIQHRVAFFEKNKQPPQGKLQLQDYGAESMSLKRVLEHQAGNLDAFARGMSYIPETAG